jgi:hypothetical protein
MNVNANNNDFEEFLLTQINNVNSNYFKIYKLNYSINMNKFIKILNLKPFYKNKIPITQNTEIYTDAGTGTDTTQSSNTIIPITNQVIDKECAICYEKIQMNVYLRQLKCNHEFHKKCIDKWLFTQFQQHKQEFTCPICRHSISP